MWRLRVATTQSLVVVSPPRLRKHNSRVLIKSEDILPTKPPVQCIPYVLPRTSLDPIEPDKLPPHLVDTFGHSFAFVVSGCLEGDLSPPDSIVNLTVTRYWLVVGFENLMKRSPPPEKINR